VSHRVLRVVAALAITLASALALTAGTAPRQPRLPRSNPDVSRSTPSASPGGISPSLSPFVSAQTQLPTQTVTLLPSTPPKAISLPTAQSGPSGFVTRNGTTLSLDGHAYRFAGVTNNEAATYWAVNWGCGSQVDDLDAFFAALRPGSLVSFSAMQAMAFNNKPLNKPANAIDFTGIDRVVRAAEKYNDKLSLGLSNQAGICDDGHWHDQAWYDGGFRQVFNDDGRNLARLSYWDYVHLIVPRYQASRAVAIWGLVGEPEASNCATGYLGGACYAHLTCPAGATLSLRMFFDTVAREIKRLDPHHLIASGTLSRGQCGLSGGGYAALAASPDIDIMSFHDYGADDTPLPTDMVAAIAGAHAAGKAFAVDEAGINAGSTGVTPAARAAKFVAKMNAQFSAGSSGFSCWNWVPAISAPSSFEIGSSDPLMGLLLTYRPPG
jgi:mannan endo-1,4-beta-mannosidase